MIFSAASLIGAQPAQAISCFQGFNCAPTNIQFPEPNSLNLSNLKVCGIQGNYAPLAAEAIDNAYDNPKPYQINSAGNGINEGNYPDSQTVEFEPATSLTGGADQTVTVTLPHPAEPYTNSPDTTSGSILPASTIGVSSLESNEQLDSTVAAFGGGSSYLVEVGIVDGPSAAVVRLDDYNPYQPQSVNNGPGQSASDNGGASINGFDSGNSMYDNGDTTTTIGGTAFFIVNDGGNQDVTFAATDVTFGGSSDIPIDQTSTVSYGTGGGSGDCGSEADSAESTAPTSDGTGVPYLVIQNSVGHFATGTIVTSASGVEKAVINVPPGISANTGDQVTVDVLDAVSPPGEGTQDHAAQSNPYVPQDFSVATTEDPVPGYPSTAPTFIGDYNDSTNLADQNCGNEFYGNIVDPCKSTLVPATSTQEVSSSTGDTVTATINDKFYNPVNDQKMDLIQTGSTDADVTPQAAEPSQSQPNPPLATTADDGTASFDVSDECAESVGLYGVDTSNNVPFPLEALGSFTTEQQYATIQFTPGASIPPDSTDPPYTPVVCGGRTAVQSSISASPPAVAADGASTSIVTVTSADQFGNVDPCQQIVLTQANLQGAQGTTHATITPLNPTHACAPPSQAGASPTTGAGFSGTDGVAQFAVSDASDESVAFAVTDTTLVSVWPSNDQVDPTDVAVVTFLPADPSQSTISASPSTVPDNGQPAATVTVTLKDSAGLPVQNKDVLLTATNSSTTTIVPQAPCGTANLPASIPAGESVTGSVAPCQGQATFDVGDIGPPHQVTYEAAYPSSAADCPVAQYNSGTGLCTLSATTSVSYVNGGDSISASPTVVFGNGTSTITYTLDDTTSTPMSGVPVTLSSNSGTTTISPGGNTNSSGQAVFTVSDTSAEAVKFTATAVYSMSAPNAPPCLPSQQAGGNCTVTIPVTVTFRAAPTSFTLSASPSTLPADGITSSQVTLTANGPTGPVVGVPVQLYVVSATSPTSNNPSTADLTGIDLPTVTNAAGQAQFSLTNLVNETVVIGAQYESNSFQSAPGTVTITFNLTAAEAEAQNSSLIAGVPAPADGSSTVTVTATLLGINSAAIVGHSVILSTGSATTDITPSPTTNVGGATNGAGVAAFTITDTKPETLNVYARDLTTGVIIGPVVVTFQPTEVQQSTINATPTSVPADTGLTTTVTVTLIGPTGGFVSGHTVKLVTGSGTTTVSPAVATGANGEASFTVSDTAVETVTLNALDTTTGLTIAATTPVSFTATEANQSSVTANPLSSQAFGPPITVTVRLLNGSGLPVSGHVVSIRGASGTATVTPLLVTPGVTPGTTNSTGTAQFSVADTAAETLILAACDTTQSASCNAATGSLVVQTATVSFTVGEGNLSTISDSASTAPAAPAACPIGGPWTCPTTTVTVTLKGAAGPLVGHVVALSATSSTVTYAAAAAPKVRVTTVTTNASGQAVFDVGDSVVQSGVVVTALDTTTGVTVVPTVTLGFTANENNQSTITAVPEFGATEYVVTVTLKGPTDAALASHKATLSTWIPPATPSGAATLSHTTSVIDTTMRSVTTSAGQIVFDVRDRVTQTLDITATDTTSGQTIYLPVNVTIFK
ncbi:MAG: beta strand repeat-containing protein [Acidimicrobiales bacterium]